ncbi:MAG: ribonuclease HI [Rickettsiales bacterium]|nr:ribonuclease HI [Rickettsiales bacterium]|tara:strand:+ start:887 stop:1336 length:450 start_codon:yes stop_codon:yes gene_type:complete
MNNNYDYIIYTDGACLGNPGPGGWAAIIIKDDIKSILKGSEKSTTNNRMEILASIKAFKSIEKSSNIKIFTDSKYLIDGINIWIKNWKLNEWKTKSKKEVKNIDLWMELDSQACFHQIHWEWVKGHSGNKLNEEVDVIARKEAESLNFV